MNSKHISKDGILRAVVPISPPVNTNTDPNTNTDTNTNNYLSKKGILTAVVPI